MRKIIDISQDLYPGMTVYPGDPRYQSHLVSDFKRGDICEVSEITVGSHCGTHVDAPSHMIPRGAAIESMPLDNFIGACRVLTIPQAVISEKALLEAQIADGERILLRTDPEGKYEKNGRFNPAVLSLRAAQLLAERHVKLVGIDAPTVENMEVCDGEIHRTLLSAGVGILEGLCLKEATGKQYLLSALPLKMRGENGAFCRAVLIEE